MAAPLRVAVGGLAIGGQKEAHRARRGGLARLLTILTNGWCPCDRGQSRSAGGTIQQPEWAEEGSVVNQKGSESPHPNKRSRSNLATVSDVGFVLDRIGAHRQRVQQPSRSGLRPGERQPCPGSDRVRSHRLCYVAASLVRLFDPARHATAGRPDGSEGANPHHARNRG